MKSYSCWLASAVLATITTCSVLNTSGHAALVSHWTFDNPANVGADSGSAGNNGILLGNAAQTNDAIVGGGALALGGTGDIVDVGGTTSFNALDDDGNGWTVAGWIKTTGNGGVSRLLSTYMPDGFTANGWGVGTSGDTLLYSTTYGIVDMQGNAGTALNGNWQHVAYVYRNNGGSIATDYYVNGSLQSSATPGNAFGINDTTNTFAIGALGLSTADQPFLGSIDDLRVYDTELTSGEILTLVTDVLGGFVTLEINRDSGAVKLTNGTGAPVPFAGYSIKSARESLNPGTWLSIADNYDADSGGTVDGANIWIEASSSGSDLSEIALRPASLAVGQSINLGTTWVRGPVEDVTMQLLLADGSGLRPRIEYVGNGDQSFQPGDLNLDGAVDSADWPVYKAGFLADLSGGTLGQGYLRGDMNYDGVNDDADFRLFKDAYDAANGAGAFAAMLASVPEPTGVLPCLFAMTILWNVGRCGRSHRLMAVLLLAFVSVATLAGREASAALTNHWTFENAANLGADSVGTQNGVVNGDATQTAGVIGTGALLLDGDGDFLSLSTGGAHFSTLDDDNDGWSIASWVNTTGNGGVMRIISTDMPDGFTANGWGLGFRQDRGSDEFISTTYGIVDMHQGTTALDGLWHHVAYVFRNNGGTISTDYYLDGGLVGTTDATQGFPMNNTTSPYAIGRLGLGTALQYFNGSIDDLRVYDNELSALDVQEIYGGVSLDMTLEVNTTTGAVTLKNTTPIDFDVDFYRISSAGGGLRPTSWNSLQDQDFEGSGANNNTGNGWEELGTPSANDLAEAFLQGSSTIAQNAEVGLGLAYNPQSDPRDIVFRYQLASGAMVDGNVEYVEGGVLLGDYNQNGSVDAADYTIWKDNFGANVAAGSGADGNGNGVIDAADYTVWKDNFGNSLSAASTAAVPEPGVGSMVLTILGAALLRRRRPGRPTMNRPHPVAKRTQWIPLLALAAVAVFLSPVFAASSVDRSYLMGDDSAEGAVVGSPAGDSINGDTFDSVGTPNAGDLNDLNVFNGAVYVDVSSRPGASAGAIGIQFDGVDDYLEGVRLGLPSSSASAVPTGPLDYSGIANRGLQFWARPNAAGNGNAQSVVLDTNQHGARITAAGTWQMRYAGVDVDSGAAVDFGNWQHVMVVRPFGAAGGARMYVDGVVVATQGGGYNGGDESPLVVGANTGDNTTVFSGTTDFYRGQIDDLKLFVMGRSTTTATDYGAFNAGEDNEFIAQAVAGIAIGDMNGDGSITGDGTGNASTDDVSAFVDNWGFERRVGGILVGDLTGFESGDLNFDGVVDLFDWHVLRTNHPNGGNIDLATVLASRGVPEPGVAAIFCSLLPLITALRRRRFH